jgi:hypothetical protein
MQMKFRLITAYIIAGLVWCIVNLPNLLPSVGNSSIKAVGLAVIRVIIWPYQLATATWHYYKKEVVDAEEGNDDE